MVSVAECRDTMKSTLLKYMVGMMGTIAIASFYLGVELASLKAQVAANAEHYKDVRKESKDEIKMFSDKLDIIVSHSRNVFEKCCDTRLTFKDGSSDFSIQ